MDGAEEEGFGEAVPVVDHAGIDESAEAGDAVISSQPISGVSVEVWQSETCKGGSGNTCGGAGDSQ